MSKIRENLRVETTDLESPPEQDLAAYVALTQLKADGPYVYAGWLDAPDDEMALSLAREHYGKDQPCTGVWIARRGDVGGLSVNAAAASVRGRERDYRIFSRQEEGGSHVSGIVVRATCAADAIERARAKGLAEVDGVHDPWAIPLDGIISTGPGDLVWRYTDQSYRLARGYSQSVREKWEKIREKRAITAYEKDDLKESF